jgi:hypothetical protein
MLKKVFLAGAAVLLLAGVTVSVSPTDVFAGRTHCFEKAKAKYGHHWKARHAYRKACHAHHRAWKKAHKK